MTTKELLLQFMEDYPNWEEDLRMEFERWLNDKWLNGNNGDNEDKREDFVDETLQSYVDEVKN